MKTMIALTSIVVGLLLSSPASAQMHSGRSGEMPMDSRMMHDHMTSMADLMSEMAEVMQKGKMNADQQAQCSAFMQRLSGLMQGLAADPQQDKTKQRQRELQELKRDWNYFKDENQSLYGN